MRADNSAATVLWYAQPALQWVEALPVGNGRRGAMVNCFAGMLARATVRSRNTTGSPRPVSVRCRECSTSARVVNFGVDQTNQRFGGQRETEGRHGVGRDQTPSPIAGGRRWGGGAKRAVESRENTRGVRDGGYGRGAAKRRERRFALADMVGATGPQQATRILADPRVAGKSAAKSAATSANSDPSDPDLACIVDAWPGLPPNVKAGIVAMVKATSQGGSVEGRDLNSEFLSRFLRKFLPLL